MLPPADTEFTYTMNDLGEFDFGERPLAVIGHPVRHSVSPAMHNAAIKKLTQQNSKFGSWSYFRFDVPPKEFNRAIQLFHAHNFFGLNLTIPHKVQAIDFVNSVSPDAENMGAVNTLLWGELGYSGFNTDGYGVSQGIREDLGATLKGADIILLGSGGAARAAAVQCLLEECKTLYVGNRSVSRLESMMEVLSNMKGGSNAQAFPLAESPSNLPESGILINATSLGLKAEDPTPFDATKLPSGWKVYDMIYNPSETALLKAARVSGLDGANGLSMLVHQGARSLEIWSRADVDSHAMMTAANHALGLPPRM